MTAQSNSNSGGEGLTPVAQDVLAERQRQISEEGWTPEHDDQHDGGEMAAAAGTYALGAPEDLSSIANLVEDLFHEIW
jgi:hypothetical protein